MFESEESFMEINLTPFSSSTPVRHRAGTRDETWWSVFIEGQWIARMPADHTWRTITRTDQLKWHEMNEMNMEKWCNEICGRGKREKPREKSIHTPFRPPRNTQGVTETRTRDPSGGSKRLNQRWPELNRGLESATGSYARARTGAAGDVNIPRYQCRPVY